MQKGAGYRQREFDGAVPVAAASGGAFWIFSASSTNFLVIAELSREVMKMR